MHIPLYIIGWRLLSGGWVAPLFYILELLLHSYFGDEFYTALNSVPRPPCYDVFTLLHLIYHVIVCNPSFHLML